MAASVPSFWNWRSPSSCEFLSSSEEEECGESVYCYDEDGYGEEEYDEEGEFVEEEEKYDEEGGFVEEEEKCDEEGEYNEDEEYDKEGGFVEEEEKYDEEGGFVEEEEECDEEGEYNEEEEYDKEWGFVEEEEKYDEEGEFVEEEEKYDEEGGFVEEEKYDEEGGFIEEEEKYDEEGGFVEEEEECDEEGEYNEEEEYDKEGGFVEEEEKYDEEGGFVEEEEKYDEEGGFVEEEEKYDEEGEYNEEEEYDKEGGFVEEEEKYDEERKFVEEEEEYDEDEYFDEQEEESYLVSDVLDCHKPSTWRYMPPNKEVDLVQLPANSPEYLKVKSKVQSTLQVHIDRVVRIQNPYIWGCYMLMKGEYEARLGSACKEMELFHATAQSNIPSVAQNNLDWRRTKRAKFGGGVSFSPLANYANKYCNVEAGTERALILARVLVGESHEGRYGLKIPAEGYDTTTGNTKRVYVKYRDNEFYPEYVAYYRQ